MNLPLLPPEGDEVERGTATTPYRIILADDHDFFRAGLRNAIHQQPGLAVIAEAGRGPDVLPLVRLHSPDLVVLDVQMPGLAGPEVARQLRAYDSRIHVVALSAHDDAAYVERFVRYGASGYITKSRPPAMIIEALREAARGETVWLVRQALDSPIYALSVRDRDLLILLAEGLQNEAIATRLHVSLSTVRNSLTALYEKIGVPNSRAAVSWAWRHKMIPQ